MTPCPRGRRAYLPNVTELAPSEVRRRVLSGHQVLREQLLALRKACSELGADGEDDFTSIRLRAEAVRDALEAQIEVEANILAPVLEETPGFGEIRCEELAAHHVAQRRLFSEFVSMLDPARPPRGFTDRACEVLDLLRRELVWEDRELLDPDVVKDDTIDISLGG